MTNQPFDDPLKELELALAVEPSPAFAARVRTRIAQESGARSWLTGWRSGVVAAAVLVVVGGALAWRAGRRVPVVPTPMSTAASVDAPAATVRGLASDRSGAAAHTALQASVATGSAEPASVARHEPEVLVPPDQAIALRMLLEAIHEGRAAVPAETKVPVDENGRLLEPAAIQVPPITIEPLVLPPNGGGGRNEL